MLILDLGKHAAKFFKKLPPKHAAQVMRKIFDLQEFPYPQDSKLLKGFSYSRVDSGEYRIVYIVKPPMLVVRLIGKRNDDEVYRKLKRME